MDLKKIIDNSDNHAQYMMDEITTIVKTCGKRLPGSEGEKKAVEYMADKLKPYCDKVDIEPFELHPNSFFYWIHIMVTMVLIGFVFYFFMPLITIIMVALGMLLMITQFVFYLEVIDFLFPKKTSHNLTAIKHPKGEVKRRIIFNGHPDATHEWTFSNLFNGKAFVAHFLISMAGLVYLVGISIYAMIANGGVGFVVADSGLTMILGLCCLIFVPFWIAMYRMWNTSVVVDGANDNLTGCYMGIAILKALADEGIEFENTELGVVLTGSEEAGLRGARAWSKKHSQAGDFKDVETIIFCYDTIREGEYLYVNKFDLNNTVKSDKYACELFYNAAKKLGIKCSYGAVPLGATDNAEFNKYGYKSAGITALNHELPSYYHTRKDSYDNMDKDCLSDCIKVSVQALEDFDNGL